MIWSILVQISHCFNYYIKLQSARTIFFFLDIVLAIFTLLQFYINFTFNFSLFLSLCLVLCLCLSVCLSICLSISLSVSFSPFLPLSFFTSPSWKEPGIFMAIHLIYRPISNINLRRIYIFIIYILIPCFKSLLHIYIWLIFLTLTLYHSKLITY